MMPVFPRRSACSGIMGVQLRPIRHMINQAQMKKGTTGQWPESKNIEAPRRLCLRGASMQR